MGFLDRLREGRDQRRTARAQRAYTGTVDTWLSNCKRATELAIVAQSPGINASSAPVQLWDGERLLVWWNGAELIAPKNTIVRDWSGASYRIGTKTTVRAGTSTTRSTVDRPTPIDRGTLAITDRRVLFLGQTRSIDWQFRRMLGVTHDDSGTWTAIHVSNRQRLHGFGYSRSRGDDVRFYLALAAALYRGEDAEFSQALLQDMHALLSSPPAPPQDVPIDDRVRQLSQQDAGAAVDTVKELAPPPKPDGLAVGFTSSSPSVVATAAKLMGYDDASKLWSHFSDAAPKRVGVAKISKVLYLMRPGMFPILDSRLTAAYEAAAREAAREVGAVRAEFAKFKRLQWEAVRRDLVTNATELIALRAAIRDAPVPLASDVAERLSDLRLLDMMAWAADGSPDDADGGS